MDVRTPIEIHRLKELERRFSELTTPLVNDSLREMNYLEQALPPTIAPLTKNMVAAGPAFTVHSCKKAIKHFDEIDIPAIMLFRARMLDDLYPGCIVIWDTDEDDRCASWGAMMTRMAKKNGCVGAVIDGGARDTADVLQQDFPVFRRFQTSNGVMGRHQWLEYETTIRIGDVKISPGDYVFGDVDGVVIVPEDLIDRVIERAERKLLEENDIERMIGESDTAEMVAKQGGIF